MAGLLHSAAQGLALVHQLGLTHQDLVASGYKNVGLVQSADGTTLTHSILFDWGYTAVDDNNTNNKSLGPQDHDDDDECNLGRACNFCTESFFPSPRVGGDHGAAHSRRRTLDFQKLQFMVHSILGLVHDAATEGQYWQTELTSRVDCGRSTQTLADFLATAAQGRSTRP